MEKDNEMDAQCSVTETILVTTRELGSSVYLQAYSVLASSTWSVNSLRSGWQLRYLNFPHRRQVMQDLLLEDAPIEIHGTL